jgi:predicted NBD/HSP70 family sugar kinase
MIYVMVDDRISIGLISAGRVQPAGQHGGDLTHVVVAGSDRLCACGRVGCLGATASVASILGPDFTDMKSESRLRLAADVTPDLEEPSRMLGRVLAPIAAALHVDRIVIGGDIAEWDAVAGLVRDTIELTVGWSPHVITSTLGQSAVMLGAAGIVLSSELGVVWG